MMAQTAPIIFLDSGPLRLAAQLWAEVRQRGRPTAADPALDADVILAAQAQWYTQRHNQAVIVVTTNLRHLDHLVTASRWQDLD